VQRIRGLPRARRLHSAARMRIVPALLVSLIGCATNPVADSYELPPAPATDGKTDSAQACGRHGDVCAPNLCGAAYSTADANWIGTCAAEDQTAEAFVRIAVSRSATATLDSRAQPRVPLVVTNDEATDALYYACSVTPESTTGLEGPEDGVGIYFAEFDYVSWKPGVPSRPRRMVYARSERRTSTPGVYRGYGSFREPGVAEYGGIGMSSDCTLKMTTDTAGTVSGTFTCDLPQDRDDGTGTVHLDGEFRCPKNTLRSGVWTKWQR
jgi:hypothetical protein